MKIVSLFLLSIIVSCVNISCVNDNSINKNQTENQSVHKKITEFSGKWKAVSYFSSSASTGVCSQEKTQLDVTFEFEKQDNSNTNVIKFSGNAPVNSYFGSFQKLSFNPIDNIITIKANTIGGTKMAGSPVLMDCEQNLYNILSESNGIQLFVDDPKRMHIGKINKTNTNQSAYLVFERIK